MHRALLALAVVLPPGACKPPAPPVEPIAAPPAGISIAMYGDGDRRFAVIDDRRTIDVAHGEVVLVHIDPGAALASLVVEPLVPRGGAGQELVVDACRRDAASSDSVRCKVQGADGKVFVRVLYVSTTLAFRSRHTVVVDGTRATIDTQFEIDLPAWGGAATLALFDGVPGGIHPPQALGGLTHELDGSTAVIRSPVRDVKARRVVVFDPMRSVSDDQYPDDDTGEARNRAWEWVELVGVKLPPGTIDILADEDTDDPVAAEVPTGSRAEVAGNLRVPLRADQLVRGTREHSGGRAGDGRLTDQFAFTVSNQDSRSRLVIVEEQLRTAKRRKVVPIGPREPTVVDDIARFELDVPANGTVRVRLAVEYEL